MPSKDFEVWWDDYALENPKEKDLAWFAWRAATERCAKVCDQFADQTVASDKLDNAGLVIDRKLTGAFEKGAGSCAEYIRALGGDE